MAQTQATTPEITAERLLLLALIEAQKPKVRDAMMDQLQTWRTWRNVRSMRRGSAEGAALGETADEALDLLTQVGRRRP